MRQRIKTNGRNQSIEFVAPKSILTTFHDFRGNRIDGCDNFVDEDNGRRGQVSLVLSSSSSFVLNFEQDETYLSCLLNLL